jgi:hypothetical protein
MIIVTSDYDVAGLARRETRLSLHEFNRFLKEIREINGDHAEEPYVLQVAKQSSQRRHGVDLRKIVPDALLGHVDDIDRALRLNRLAAAEDLFDLLAGENHHVVVLMSEDDPDMWEFEIRRRGDNAVETADDSYRITTTAMTGAVLRLAEHLQIDNGGLVRTTERFLDAIDAITAPGGMPVGLIDQLPVQFAKFSGYIFNALDDQDAYAATKIRDRLLNQQGVMPHRWRFSGLEEREDGFYEVEISSHSPGGARGDTFISRPARSLYTAMIGAAMMAYAHELELGRLPN